MPTPNFLQGRRPSGAIALAGFVLAGSFSFDSLALHGSSICLREPLNTTPSFGGAL